MSKCHSFCHSVLSHFLGLWLVENIIVIEVEVDEVHKGKTLSRPSTSITISAVAQENKKNNERLSCATLGNKPNQKLSTYKFTATVYGAVRIFLRTICDFLGGFLQFCKFWTHGWIVERLSHIPYVTKYQKMANCCVLAFNDIWYMTWGVINYSSTGILRTILFSTIHS